MGPARVGMDEQENSQQRYDEERDAGTEVGDPPSDTQAGNIDQQDQGEEAEVERRDDAVAVGDPGGARAERCLLYTSRCV